MTGERTTNARSYAARVLGEAFREFKWGRDLTISTAIAVLTALVQFDAGMPATESEKRIVIVSLIAPYIIVFGAHVGWKVLCAPYRIHQRQELRLATSETKIKDIEEQGPEVMLSFDWNDNSREYQGIGVHNVADGTAHRINVQIGSDESTVEFALIPYLEEGARSETRPTLFTVNHIRDANQPLKLISFLRMYSAHMHADKIAVPVTLSFENGLGTVFEQDFELVFIKSRGANGVAGMVKRGQRRIVRVL